MVELSIKKMILCILRYRKKITHISNTKVPIHKTTPISTSHTISINIVTITNNNPNQKQNNINQAIPIITTPTNTPKTNNNPNTPNTPNTAPKTNTNHHHHHQYQYHKQKHHHIQPKQSKSPTILSIHQVVVIGLIIILVVGKVVVGIVGVRWTVWKNIASVHRIGVRHIIGINLLIVLRRSISFRIIMFMINNRNRWLLNHAIILTIILIINNNPNPIIIQLIRYPVST